MTSDYQSTIDQIKILKNHDTIDELIDDTLGYIQSIGENAKEIGLTNYIQELEKNKNKENFDNFIKAYFKLINQIDVENIQEVFYYFYNKKGYDFNDNEINKYKDLLKQFFKNYGKNKEGENEITINRRKRQYIHNILAPYCKRKIEIYECKNKISRQENNIQTVLDELKKLKDINIYHFNFNGLQELKEDINSITDKCTDIFDFFYKNNKYAYKKAQEFQIKDTLNKIKETKLKQQAESQYRQYTYKKS